MITANAGPLVPEWVWLSSFPRADEVRLAELGAGWTNYAAGLTDTADGLATAFEQMDSHTGPGAEAAAAKAATVRGWLGTIAEGAESLGETAGLAGLLVTAAKRAMNVVLASLQVSLGEVLIAMSLSPVADKAVALLQIRQLHIAGQAHCQAIAAALTEQLALLSPEVDIRPKPSDTTVGGDRMDDSAGPDGEPDPFAPFRDTGLTVPSPLAAEQARDLVGADEHDIATTALDAALAAPLPDNPWATAAEEAYTDEERAALREQAAEALGTGDTSGYDVQALSAAAESVSAEEIDPRLLTASGGQPGIPAGADGPDTPLTLEEILGGPRPAGPPSAGTTDPVPGAATDTGSPGTTAAGVPLSSISEPTGHQGTERPAERAGQPVAVQPAPTPRHTAPAPVPMPGTTSGGTGSATSSGGTTAGSGSTTAGSGSTTAGSGGTTTGSGSSTGSTSAGSTEGSGGTSAGSGSWPSSSGGPAAGGGSGPAAPPDAYRPPTDPRVPGTISAGVSAPPQGGTNPVLGGPIMGAPGAPPPPSAPIAPAGPNLTSAPMPMPGGPAGPSGMVGGPAAPTSATGGPVNAPQGPASTTQQPPPPQQPAKPPPAAAPIQAAPATQQQQQPTATPKAEGAGPSDDRAAKAGATATVAVGAGLLGSVWDDLRRPAPPAATRGGPMIAWPTQFGRHDDLLASLPAGMSVPYQRVLLPGESDALLSGQVTTVRGLVHPVEQVRHLATPAELFDALGLGYPINEHTSPTAAFDRRADWLDVLRFAGVRDRDLIVPVEAGVPVGDDPAIRPMVRDHARPWTGTGSAPGATSTGPIEEFEILGTRSLTIPHLAELWRIHSFGNDQHLATWDARTATWQGPAGGQVQAVPDGRQADNGTFATLLDGTSFRATVLTDRYTVLIAHGVQAPADFVPVTGGSRRKVVPNDQVVRWLHVTTRARWAGTGTPVHVLRRAGEYVLVDYAGDSRAAAAQAGFVQLAQGQWVPRWVPWPEIVGQYEDVSEYPNLMVAQSLG